MSKPAAVAVVKLACAHSETAQYYVPSRVGALRVVGGACELLVWCRLCGALSVGGRGWKLPKGAAK